MIQFNVPYQSGKETTYIQNIFEKGSFQGNGPTCNKLSKRLEEFTGSERVFTVHSCTSALEIAALAMDIQLGDEVIMPSYTYVSTGNAFALRGATLVFVDVDPRTMCLNLNAVEQAITTKTKAVVPVHYAGVSCDMDSLMTLARTYGFLVVEDAAQSINSFYKGNHLGTIGHVGCISCHETKNLHAAGEGGFLLINESSLIRKVEQIIEKGTNRQAFLNDEVDRYTWQTLGSSYGMAEVNAGFYLAQMEDVISITAHRKRICDLYRKRLSHLKSRLEWLHIPDANMDNGHLFYIKLKDELERSALKAYLSGQGIQSVSHYEPLHLSAAGQRYGYFSGTDHHTTQDSKRLLRLPVHNHLTIEDAERVATAVNAYFKEVNNEKL